MLGLALSGGGIRCVAHLGVLKVCQREGIEFDIIAGSSAGSLMAVLYALGIDLAALERWANRISWQEAIGWRFSRHGIGDAGRFRQFLRSLTGGVHLEDLPRRVLITATDIASGSLQVLDRGDAADAIYASCALPGIFPPLRKNGRVLVDGSFLAPLPVDLIRRHGARRCVGINCPDGRGYPARHVFDTVRRCIEVMMQQLSADCLKGADVLLSPPVGEYGIFDFRKINRCIAEGELTALAALPQLKRLCLRPELAHQDQAKGALCPEPAQ